MCPEPARSYRPAWVRIGKNRVRLRDCLRCQRRIAWVEDEVIDVGLDLDPLDTRRELIAVLEGRLTYGIFTKVQAAERRTIGTYVKASERNQVVGFWRYVGHWTAERIGQVPRPIVLPEHRCNRPLPR